MPVARALTCVLLVPLLMALQTEPSSRPVTLADVPGLPGVLRAADGSRVATAEAWQRTRRPELLEQLSREMYGRVPSGLKATWEVVEESAGVLVGKADRKQMVVYLTGDKAGPRMDLLVYIPANARGPVPVILGLNFWGNHTVTADPGVRVPVAYTETGMGRYIQLAGVKDNRPSAESRGLDAGRWAIEAILARGYGFATAYRGEIDPDLADLAKLPAWCPKPLRLTFPDLRQPGEEMTAMGAWAFALSRAMDGLEATPGVDRSRVAVFGWSRLGKAALWAAATDERFALLLSAESGSGGAKLFHYRAGESVRRLNTNFPHWFCGNYDRHNDREGEMPFDSHFAIALIAPRPAYFSSSAGDAIFDPVGEFLGPKAAEPVYTLLGHPNALPAESVPPRESPVMGRLGYHTRTGPHDVTAYDWEQYLAFCDRWLKR